MKGGEMHLTFRKLQEVNKERSAAWGEPDLESAAIELGGEVGECLNAVKKYLRAKNSMAGGRGSVSPIMDEVADVVICCAIMANTLGYDLGTAVTEKFNETSENHGFPTHI